MATNGKAAAAGTPPAEAAHVTADDRETLRREYQLRDPRVVQLLDYLELVERSFLGQLRRTEEMEARLTRSVSAALGMHERLAVLKPAAEDPAAAEHAAGEWDQKHRRGRDQPPRGKGGL